METYPFKNSSPGGEGESKGNRKFDEKAAAGWFCSRKYIPFSQLVLPDARRFWATSPPQLIYHKDFSSNCARGMSNPITHITRILLAIDRMRREKEKERKPKAGALQDLFLCHN
jgi:hypothetical protein